MKSDHSPTIRPYGNADVPAPTGREAQALDQRAQAEFSVAGTTLMESAGRSAASIVQRVYPQGRVFALVGSGNNGGDALVAARTLAARGRDVALVAVGPRDADHLLHGWSVPWTDPAELSCGSGDVVLDGILGTGLRGAPRPDATDWIQRANDWGATIVALDVPSGVDADSGAVPGAVINAHLTIAFGWPKLGTLLHPARAAVGRLVAVEIGFPPTKGGFAAQVITPGWFHAAQPQRDPVTHKNQVGALLLVAGARGMAGAAIMAGRAALQAGVGLLRVASPEENREILQEALPEALFVNVGDPAAMESALEQSGACAIGPGLGIEPQAERALRQTLAVDTLPLVVDADALNLLAGWEPTEVARHVQDRAVLLTPHPGEMRRLLGDESFERGSRPESARRLAEESGAAVIYKGTPALVASRDGHLLVGTQGSSDLATAGLGDVLAGAAGAILAAGVAAPTAGGIALHLTGRAANLADRGRSLVPQDVIDQITNVWQEAGPGHTDLDLPEVTFDQDPPR